MAALSPVEARSSLGALGIVDLADVGTDRLEEIVPVRRDRQPSLVIVDVVRGDEAAVNRDGELSSEVVIASAGMRQVGGDLRVRWLGGRGTYGLQQFRHARVGESPVAMSALSLHGDDISVEELGEMFTRCGGCDADVPGELAAGVCPPIHQGAQNLGA